MPSCSFSSTFLPFLPSSPTYLLQAHSQARHRRSSLSLPLRSHHSPRRRSASHSAISAALPRPRSPARSASLPSARRSSARASWTAASRARCRGCPARRRPGPARARARRRWYSRLIQSVHAARGSSGQAGRPWARMRTGAVPLSWMGLTRGTRRRDVGDGGRYDTVSVGSLRSAETA